MSLPGQVSPERCSHLSNVTQQVDGRVDPCIQVARQPSGLKALAQQMHTRTSLASGSFLPAVCEPSAADWRRVTIWPAPSSRSGFQWSHPRGTSGSTAAGQPHRGGSQGPSLTLASAVTSCVASLSLGVMTSLATFVKSPNFKPQFPNLSRAALNQDKLLPRGMLRLRHTAVDGTSN